MMQKEMVTLERVVELVREFEDDFPTEQITQEMIDDINLEITGGVDTKAGGRWDGGGGAKDVAEVIWTVLSDEDLCDEDKIDEFVDWFDKHHA